MHPTRPGFILISSHALYNGTMTQTGSSSATRRVHAHPAALAPEELLKACETMRSKGSGPGGQHRNKVETAITLTHKPSGVMGAASERRSQVENAKAALFRLRVNLALEVRGDYSLTHGPSDLLRSRVVKGRLLLNPEHVDFPAILAEVLDLLWLKHWDVATAASLLELTSTQVVKLLRQEPRALAICNEQRQHRGLHSLH
jgi:hypothetical protein